MILEGPKARSKDFPTAGREVPSKEWTTPSTVPHDFLNGILLEHLDLSVSRLPALRSVLLEHRLQSPYSQGRDFVFASEQGTALGQRNVAQRGLGKAVERAGLNREGIPNVTFHALRHTFASMQIAEDGNVVYVSRRLGHANPAITLKVYAHEFSCQEQADRMSKRLQDKYGALL